MKGIPFSGFIDIRTRNIEFVVSAEFLYENET